MANLRVVLDTNVLVSGLAYPASIPGRIVGHWRHGGLEVVLSHFILDELTRVLPRLPHLTMNPAEVRDMIDSLMFIANLIEPGPEQDEELRDPADQQVLATLRVSKADYLITGDKDLLALAGRFPIVTPATFWTRHG